MKHVVDKEQPGRQADKVGEIALQPRRLQLGADRRSDPQRAADHRQEGRDRRGCAARSARRSNITRGALEGTRSAEGFGQRRCRCPAPITTATRGLRRSSGTAPSGSRSADWIAPMKDKVRAAARQGSRKDYASSNHRLAEAHRGLRQVELVDAMLSPPRKRGALRVPSRVRCASFTDARPLPVTSVATATRSGEVWSRPPQAAAADAHPRGQQHRGDLRPRHPRAEGRVARRAERRRSWRCSAPTAPARPRR